MNFFSRYKKIFLVLSFIIVVIGLGYLIWTLFFQSAPFENGTVTAPGQVNGLPSAGPNDQNPAGTSTGIGILPNGTVEPGQNEPSPVAVGGQTKITTLTDTPVLDPTLSRTGGGVQYYDPSDGRFYKLGANGKLVLMSDKVFHNVDNVVWSPTKDKAVIEYPDGNKIMYDFSSKQQVTLPAHWQDFSFSSTGGQITAKSLGLDPENHWLVVSNDDGSKAKTIENIGSNDASVYPNWSPSGQIIAMYTKGVDLNRQEVYFVGQNGENFKSTVIEGRGFEPLWSTTGDRLLYSVYNTDTNLNPTIWIVDAAGDTISQNRTSLGLSTWASKCTFASNSEVYCAVPENLDKGAGLFPEMADKTKDNLFRINLQTGAKELIAVPDGAYNISNIMVPASDDSLYFTDKKTNQLYQVRLR